MSRPTGFSRGQITLHWIVAALIFGAWFTHDGMGRALRARIAEGMTGMEGATPHTVLGGMAFAFVLVRIILRLRRGAPDPNGSPAMQKAAKWGHGLLYGLMAVVPALGAATWYGGIESLGEVHETLAQVLMIVILGHAAVAIWHQFVRKDGTLTRMIRPS